MSHDKCLPKSNSNIAKYTKLFKEVKLETLTFDNKPKVFVDHVRRSSSSVDCPCRTEGFKRSELKVARRFPARSDDDLLFQVTFAIQAVLKLLSQRIEDNEDQRQLLFNYVYKYLERLTVFNSDRDKDCLEFIRDKYCDLFRLLIGTFSRVICESSACSQATDMVLAKCSLSNEGFAQSLSVLEKFMPSDWCPITFLCSSRYNSDFTEITSLGKGGFGKVFKVKNKLDGMLYAIKRIPLYVVDERGLHLVQREVQLMASLKHEHIVSYFTSWWEHGFFAVGRDSLDSMETSDSLSTTVLEVQEVADVFCKKKSIKPNTLKGMPVILHIQMELCETTLEKFLKSRIVLCSRLKGHSWDIIDPEWGTTIFYQILLAVQYLHEHSMMHRDLKPANIFLDKKCNHVKIGDFGLARFERLSNIEELDNPPLTPFQNYTNRLGTTFYAAPEQLHESNYDKKADMYSLGIIVFELFYPFGTMAERVNILQRLRDQQGCIKEVQEIEKRWPNIAGYIRSLLCHIPQMRPSAQQLLSSMFILKSDKERISELQEENKRKDSEIMKLKKRIQKQNTQIHYLMKERKKMRSVIYSAQLFVAFSYLKRCTS